MGWGRVGLLVGWGWGWGWGKGGVGVGLEWALAEPALGLALVASAK